MGIEFEFRSGSACSMKFLIIGTGAIGIYIGGYLLRGNNEVVFIAREKTINTLMQTGLEICQKGKKFQYSSPLILSDIKRAFDRYNFDAVIVAVKAYDVEQVIKKLKPFAKNIRALICFQNGVGTEKKFGRVFGNKKIIAGIVTSAISKVNIGCVQLEKNRGIGLSSENKSIFDIIDVFNNAGLKTKFYRNPKEMKWSKLVSNLFANASSAILDMTPESIFANPDLFKLEISQIKEAMQVIYANNWHIVNLPGVPLSLLAAMIKFLPVKLNQVILKNVLAGGRGKKMPSFYIDLARGSKRCEVKYLNGAVVYEGEKFNIPTPVNRVYARVLTRIFQGKYERREFHFRPDKLIKLIS